MVRLADNYQRPITAKVVTVLLSMLLLTACATTTPVPVSTLPMQSISAAEHPPAWRTCYFGITWPQSDPPKMELDLLLAHQLIGPVIAESGHQIQSWRFHRRAARDNAGHLFRFHFYTDTNIAAAIIDRIQQHPLRAQLLDTNTLQSAYCDNPTDMSRPGIGDTSDPNWPETVQNNWPDYIMGISKFWLGLIDDAVMQTGTPATDIDKLVQQYIQANDTITAIWQAQGQHALLHHLNALFGYQPLQIRF